MPAKPNRVHGSSLPVTSETGMLLIDQPTSRRSVTKAVPTNKPSSMTCADSSRGQAYCDSRSAMLVGNSFSHVKNSSSTRQSNGMKFAGKSCGAKAA